MDLTDNNFTRAIKFLIDLATPVEEFTLSVNQFAHPLCYFTGSKALNLLYINDKTYSESARHCYLGLEFEASCLDLTR